MFLIKLQKLFAGRARAAPEAAAAPETAAARGAPPAQEATAARATAARGAATTPTEKQPVDTRLRTYEAVAIRPTVRACREVRALAGKRFLVAEAPKVPLPSCVQRCRCVYENHPDRRDETRRAIDVGISSSWYVGSERRSGLDRRGTGPADGNPSYYDFMRGSRSGTEPPIDGTFRGNVGASGALDRRRTEL